MKRSTIGNNPLDAVVPNISKLSNLIPTSIEEESQKKEAKERLTVHLPLSLINRVKNAVFYTPGLTLAELAELALTRAIEDLEMQRGEPFPQRTKELAGGRPMK